MITKNYSDLPESYIGLIFKPLIREMKIIWLFCKSSIFDVFVFSFSAFFSGWLYFGEPLVKIFIPMIQQFVYTVFVALTFTTLNQLNSVEEDRLNKPDRPRVIGIIDYSGHVKRIFICNALFLIIGYLFGIETFFCAVACILLSMFLNLGGGSSHWFLKNPINMTIAAIIIVYANWVLALPDGVSIPGHVIIYIFLLSIYGGLGIIVQDMRDIEGDNMANRKTFPIILGEKKKRKIIAFYYLTIGPVLYFILMACIIPYEKIFYSWLGWLILVFQALTHFLIAYRSIVDKTYDQNNNTYIIFLILSYSTMFLILLK